jgi:pantetheine-phosphate adenylyltransferase
LDLNIYEHKSNYRTLCGQFDPFTVGHLSIVKQAVEIFDKVIVAKGINPDKLNKLPEDRYPLPTDALKALTVETRVYNTLLTELITELENEYFNVVLVRGLRNGADLEYEQNLIAFLRGMKPGLKVTAFYCDPIYRHVSSSALRGIQKFSEQEYRKYVV